MREFFRGWKRKAGVMTLLMALGLMGAWIRSQMYIESGVIRLNEDQVLAGCSNRGSFRLITFQYFGKIPSNDAFPIGIAKWERATVISNDLTFMEDPDEIFVPVFFRLNTKWHSDWQLLGFRFVEATLSDGSPVEVKCSAWKIPYWSVTINLTLLSFWLLVSKPRKSTLKTFTETIPRKERES